MQDHMIITLSRQYGSGGREVCELLSEKLNIPYFDREILTDAAEKLGVLEADYETLNQMSYKTDRITFGVDMSFPRDAFQRSDNNQMFLQQSAIIRKLASQGSAIFLGRCSDYVLKDQDQCYSFYTYADDEFRARRAAEKYGNMTLKDLEKIDKKRRTYYRLHTGGRELGEKTNYHMMLNAGKTGTKAAADVIMDYISKVQKPET